LNQQHHEGHEVTALRRQGIDTEISLKNDAIKAKNLEAAREYQQIIKGLDQEIIVPTS
jgi:predicted component of type VI protein secretion system